MNNKKIVALGPNPAWQKTLFFDGFSYGNINRASELRGCSGGKGINFTRAAKKWGKCECEVVQFSGGVNGELMEEDLQREGIAFFSVHTDNPIRCCTTCVDRQTGIMTELIEPTFPPPVRATANLLETFQRRAADAGAVALCGTTPTGTDPAFYAMASRIAFQAGVPVLLDAWRNVLDVLCGDGEIWLKINRDELSGLTGMGEVTDGLKAVFDGRYRALRLAAITDGAGRAYCSDGKRTVVYTLPQVKSVNPIGCGDTTSAVWTSEMLCGANPFDAFCTALAAATASVQTPDPASFDLETARKIRDLIICE